MARQMKRNFPHVKNMVQLVMKVIFVYIFFASFDQITNPWHLQTADSLENSALWPFQLLIIAYENGLFAISLSQEVKRLNSPNKIMTAFYRNYTQDVGAQLDIYCSCLLTCQEIV